MTDFNKDRQALLAMCDIPLSVDVVLHRIGEIETEKLNKLIFLAQTELLERSEDWIKYAEHNS